MCCLVLKRDTILCEDNCNCLARISSQQDKYYIPYCPDLTKPQKKTVFRKRVVREIFYFNLFKYSAY